MAGLVTLQRGIGHTDEQPLWVVHADLSGWEEEAALRCEPEILVATGGSGLSLRRKYLLEPAQRDSFQATLISLDLKELTENRLYNHN